MVSSTAIIECIPTKGDNLLGYINVSYPLPCDTKWLLSLSCTPSVQNFSIANRWVPRGTIPAGIPSQCTFVTSSYLDGLVMPAQILTLCLTLCSSLHSSSVSESLSPWPCNSEHHYVCTGWWRVAEQATAITGSGGHHWQMEERSHVCCKKQCVLTSIDWDTSAKTGKLQEIFSSW